MSYTGVFTEAKTESGDNPKILNYKKLIDELEKYDWKPNKIIKTGEAIEEASYPEIKYKTFLGFRTWEKDIIKLYNIERFGERYDKDWTYLFELVSKYTEDFSLCHSLRENDFPRICDEEDLEYIYGEFKDGESELKRVKLTRNDTNN